VSNQNGNSEGNESNPIDEFLSQEQEGEISRPESVVEGVFDIKADDLAHRPHETSQEHSLDDTHETLTPDIPETDLLGEATEDAMKESEQD
jgi:hypothetical protein